LPAAVVTAIWRQSRRKTELFNAHQSSRFFLEMDHLNRAKMGGVKNFKQFLLISHFFLAIGGCLAEFRFAQPLASILEYRLAVVFGNPSHDESSSSDHSRTRF
jgi:hypothetical protein